MKLVNLYLLIRYGLTILFILPVVPLQDFSLNAQPLTLEQCIDTALLYNRSIKMSAHDLAIASEKNKEVKSNLIPKLNGMADYRYYIDQPYQLMPAEAFGGPEGTYKEVQFGTPHTLNANLQLTLPLYNPSIYSAMGTTKSAVELVEIQKNKTEEQVIIDVSIAYYNAQILLNQLLFIDSNIVNMKTLINASDLLYQQQMARQTDVDKLSLNLEKLKLQRSTAFSQYQQVLNALKFQMGKPLSDTISILPRPGLAQSENFKPGLTTDIKLINKKYELRQIELNGLKKSRLPSLNAYGVYGMTGFGDSGSNGFFELYPVTYAGVQLAIPIFNGTVTRHKITQKNIELQQASVQKELLAEKTTLERINAEMQYDLAKSNIAAAQDHIGLAGRIYRNTVLQNQEGVASINDILLADNALREAQQNYLNALVELRKAELEYKRSTGNILTINN
jgi:OMF family outer membrane factor